MPHTLTRRAFFQAMAAGAVTAASGYALLEEPGNFSIEPVKVESALPAGLRIGALSDFHLCDAISQTRVETAVRLLRQQQPDLIVLLGDYSTAMHSGSVIHRQVEIALQILGKLSAPLGVYAILGNHDVTPKLNDIGDIIRRNKITALIDDGVMLAVHGERFGIAGLADTLQMNANPTAAVRAIPNGTPLLGLIHEPDSAAMLPQASLVLSGHSHGGQVRLPGIGALVLPQRGRRFPWGLRQDGNTLVYTTRGVGMVPPRVRINCPPEITIIETVSAGGRVPMGPVT